MSERVVEIQSRETIQREEESVLIARAESHVPLCKEIAKQGGRITQASGDGSYIDVLSTDGKTTRLYDNEIQRILIEYGLPLAGIRLARGGRL